MQLTLTPNTFCIYVNVIPFILFSSFLPCYNIVGLHLAFLYSVVAFVSLVTWHTSANKQCSPDSSLWFNLLSSELINFYFQIQI